MDKITINLEFLAGVLGTTVGSLVDSLKIDDSNFKPETEVQAFLAEQFRNKLEAAKIAGKNESYGRAKKEEFEKAESEVATILGVEKTTLKEMLESYAEANKKPNKANPNDVRNSEAYLEDMKVERQKYSELKTEFENFKSNNEKSQTEKTVRERGMELITEGGFILPTDTAKRNKQLEIFFKDLLGEGIKFAEDPETKKIKVLDSEGNPVRNEMLNEVDFDSFIKGKANSTWDVDATGGRDTTGNKSKPPHTKKEDEVQIPPYSTTEEFVKLSYEIADTKVLSAMEQDYKARQAKGEFTEN